MTEPEANKDTAGTSSDDGMELLDVYSNRKEGISGISPGGRRSVRRGTSLREATKQSSALIKAPRIVFKGHSKTVLSLAVLRTPDEDDTLILSGGEDKLLMIWSLATGEHLTTIKGHDQRVAAIATLGIRGCPPLAVTASWDETLRIWPLEMCYAHNGTPEELSANLLTASTRLRGHKNRVFGVTTILDHDRKPICASGSADNKIIVWTLPKGEKLYELYNEKDVTWNLCLSSFYVEPKLSDEHDTIAVGPAGAVAATTKVKKSAIVGPVIISGCKNNTVRIWKVRKAGNFPTGSQAADSVIRGHTSRIHSLSAYDAFGEAFIVTVCRDFDIRVWSLASGELKKTLTGHTSSITWVCAYDCDDRRGGAVIVSGSVKGNIRVWKHSTGADTTFFP